jgi:hypothetical protein
MIWTVYIFEQRHILTRLGRWIVLERALVHSVNSNPWRYIKQHPRDIENVLGSREYRPMEDTGASACATKESC